MPGPRGCGLVPRPREGPAAPAVDREEPTPCKLSANRGPKALARSDRYGRIGPCYGLRKRSETRASPSSASGPTIAAIKPSVGSRSSAVGWPVVLLFPV